MKLFYVHIEVCGVLHKKIFQSFEDAMKYVKEYYSHYEKMGVCSKITMFKGDDCIYYARTYEGNDSCQIFMKEKVK